ncbi:MAG: serine/threonine-protein kinase [Polyangiaceae bacterium]
MLDAGQVGAPLPRLLGRYALYDEIASGGMAVVHFGHVAGAAGFSRPVAVKRLHPQFARDPEFVSMFLDEARVAARVQHPNVVSTVDVVAMDGELFLVLEYVHGESLAGLLRACRERGERLPPAVAVAILSGALAGLHAAHQATDSDGRPLCVVHRDVSPHNILVGADGVTRVLDFGVAKATVRAQSTREGQLKGKLRYMAPEQLRGAEVTRTADVYSAGVVLWEALTGDRLFSADNDAALFGQVLEGVVVPPSRRAPTLPRGIDAPVLRALQREPSLRFATARDMAIGLEAALAPASPHEVGAWVERRAGEALAHRAEILRRIEGGIGGPAPSRPARRESTATEAGPLATGALCFAASSWSGRRPAHRRARGARMQRCALRVRRRPCHRAALVAAELAAVDHLRAERHRPTSTRGPWVRSPTRAPSRPPPSASDPSRLAPGAAPCRRWSASRAPISCRRGQRRLEPAPGHRHCLGGGHGHRGRRGAVHRARPHGGARGGTRRRGGRSDPRRDGRRRHFAIDGGSAGDGSRGGGGGARRGSRGRRHRSQRRPSPPEGMAGPVQLGERRRRTGGQTQGLRSALVRG